MDPVRIGRLTFTPPSDNTYNQHIDTDQNLRADINHQEDLAGAKNACDQILAGKEEGDKLFIQLFWFCCHLKIYCRHIVEKQSHMI